MPLLLGLLAGAVLLFVFSPERGGRGSAGLNETGVARSPTSRDRLSGASAGGQTPSLVAPPAAVARPLTPFREPPRSVPEKAGGPTRSASAPVKSVPPKGAAKTAAASVPLLPALVLQAISERNSHPIAIISDQLVKEGDLIGRARVLRIGEDSVEVLLESGRKEIVRFAPPPPPEPSASPDAN